MDLVLLGNSVLALGFMGSVAGVLLSVAAKRFHVEVDSRVAAVYDALPGSNCGACGHASCFMVAEAMAAGTLGPSVCIAGGQAVIDTVAEILDAESCAVEHVVVLRHCGGGDAAARAYEYDGIRTCAAAERLAGSPLTCPAGCIGFGDCVRACPFDAMQLDERGLPVIDLDRCTGCEACVRECPRGRIGLFGMVPEAAAVAVRCGSHDKAKQKRSYCPVSCIACRKCEKECPADAIHVIDFLAVVDYERCTGCGVCVSVCPQDCIDLHGRDAIVPSAQADGKAAEVPGFESQAAENESGSKEQ